MKTVTLPPNAKILVVKLADLGDVLTATPALRALRKSYPHATIDLLLTHHTAPLMQHSPLVDKLIPSDNFRFLNPKAALKPHLLSEGIALLQNLHRQKYTAVLILHHLTLRAGAIKYALIARATGAKVVAGIRAPHRHRGHFLTHSMPDLGFGVKHEVDYWLSVAELLNARTENRAMEMSISPVDEQWATQLLADIGTQKPMAVIHPGSGGFSVARRWSPQNFAAVADSLAEKGWQIMLIGTQNDGTDLVKSAMQNTPVDLTGQTSVHQISALLKRVQLFIGGDSGVSHIAAAAGVPMVGIFGPTHADAWGMRGVRRMILQANLACQPCAYVGHNVGLRHGCAAKTCLKMVTPTQVLSAVENILTENLSFITEDTLPASKEFSTAKILGVRLHAITFKQVLAQVEAFIEMKKPHQICTVNPEFVVTARHDAVFQRIINRASLAFADGNGLLKAARWLKQTPLPERIAGVDMVEALAKLSAEKGYRIFFLGAMPGVAEKTVRVLKSRYPNMVSAGTFAGSPRAADEDEITAIIQASAADIVLVAYGAPAQDKWIARNMHRMPASVLMGIGGAFDFISGTAKRAPFWIRRIGFEWLHRFIKEPWRWRRMFTAVPHFLWLVWLEKFGLIERIENK